MSAWQPRLEKKALDYACGLTLITEKYAYGAPIYVVLTRTYTYHTPHAILPRMVYTIN